ncbi:MAG: LysM peptidoglycan-binding domain-containing protein [Vampirovibrionales bacterium]|nr:LysM peptidoglycan-binding domain-containing protein [Vampirovibrionales bacterium]
MPINSEHEETSAPSATSAQPREKAPGVYVRANEYQPQELDMLWSGSRHFVKEDRSPIVFTVVGVLVGAIITSALFFLFTSKPRISAGGGALTQPVISETGVAPKVYEPITVSVNGGQRASSADNGDSPAATRVLRQDALAPSGGNSAESSSNASSEVSASSSDASSAQGEPSRASSYEVQSGDTLERIARRFYGSGAPDMVAKIQRANAMSSPDKLQIGQQLAIPPKTY